MLIGFLAAALLVPVLLVLLPIRIGVQGELTGHGAAGCGWVRAWAGLAGLRLRTSASGMRLGLVAGPWVLHEFGLSREPKPKKARGPRKAKPEEPTETPGLAARVSGWLDLLEMAGHYVRELKPALWAFLGRLRRSLTLHRLCCRGVFGTGNPALTGRLFGYILAATSAAGVRPQVDLEADFVRPRLTGEGALELSLYLRRVIWAVLCLGVRAGWVWCVWTCVKWRRRRSEGRAEAVGDAAGG